MTLEVSLIETRGEKVQAQFLGPDAVEWRQVTHQHEVEALKARREIDGLYIGRHLHHAEQRGVPTRIRAHRAQLGLAQGAA
jgi:UDP-2,3-diacylglucosamine pyrophosphatase LpxH